MYTIQKIFVGYDWTLLDSIYLQNKEKRNPIKIEKWRVFFLKIGVTDFIEVKKTKVEISTENIVSRPQSAATVIPGCMVYSIMLKFRETTGIVYCCLYLMFRNLLDKPELFIIF
jgi:hypothetical protein